MKLHAVFRIVITALAVVFPFSLRAQTKLDHFTVYSVSGSPSPDVSVKLKGRFDPTPNDARVRDLTFYSTWVNKNKEGILDKNAHLAWHTCEQKVVPKRAVVITDQFGTQRLTLGLTKFLLVPSARIGTPTSPRLDHYLAYQVSDAPARPIRPVSLTDDFGTVAPAAVGKPKYFCVPVEKVHNDKTFPMHNRRDCLTVYEVSPSRSLPGFAIANQIGRFKFPGLVRRYLAVPTEKVRPL
jgi:hypothetical protein